MMKSIVVSLIAIFLFCSCSSQPPLANWRGESLGSLIAEYGTPVSFLKLNDGSRVVQFHFASTKKLAGNYCQLTFMIDGANKIQGVNGQGNGVSCVN
jgi:hypothetical protein